MKTQQEIIDRIKQLEESGDDFLGFQREDLLCYLDYENALQFFKKENAVTKEGWDKLKGKSPKKQMIEYMDFAWEKAIDKRGLSAMRSIEHYKAWLWLEDDKTLHEVISKYEFYGKPQLRLICEYLGLDPDKYDDGVREND